MVTKINWWLTFGNGRSLVKFRSRFGYVTNLMEVKYVTNGSRRENLEPWRWRPVRFYESRSVANEAEMINFPGLKTTQRFHIVGPIKQVHW